MGKTERNQPFESVCVLKFLMLPLHREIHLSVRAVNMQNFKQSFLRYYPSPLNIRYNQINIFAIPEITFHKRDFRVTVCS